ncbi:MAG: DUF1566 domain-containing protein [Sulfurovum sp.]|nr:DUF1566 domain-containing protein [Sulfurovum sp.]
MKRYMILSFMVLLANTSIFANETNKSSIVTDKIHTIYWQDNLSSQKSSEDWDDAVEYCDKLVLNSIDKWRLPTFNELLSIVDYTRVNPAINPVFDYVHEGTYWTSLDFSATTSRAWTIDFRTGKTFYSYKTTNHSVRCVKDIPVPSAKDKK